MNSKNENASDSYFREMSIVLEQNHFEVSSVQDNLLPISFCGEPLCAVTESGGVRYKPESINSVAKDEARDCVVKLSKIISEYMRNMETASPLKALGLGDGFKLLAEYNGCVLAGRYSESNQGVQFVTWEWGYDHKGLCHGHYYENNYLGAKEDFAQRSGLVDKHRLFTDEQLAALYRIAEATLDKDFELSEDTTESLKGICNQIEYALPGVQAHINVASQTSVEKQNQQLNI